MPDRQAFLQMICNHPDEDGPRLVYADWLEEQGETARAEFIRLHCERAQLPLADRKGRQRLTQRTDELDQLHRAEWLAELPKIAGVEWHDFHRGFFRHAIITGVEPFLESANDIFAAAPIRIVTFRNLSTTGAQQLADSAWLERVWSLNIGSNNLGDDGVIPIVQSRHVRHLHTLLSNGNALTATAAARIADSRWLASLVRLFLPANQIGDSGAESLATSTRLDRVEEVVLSANNIHETGGAHLRRRWGEKAFF